MGSNSSSVFPIAEWNGSNNICYCKKRDNLTYEQFEKIKEKNQTVEEIEWYVLPLMNTGKGEGAIDRRSFLNILTSGFSYMNYFEGKPTSRDVLKAKIKCRGCGDCSTYTLEFNDTGSYMNCGEYKRNSSTGKSNYLYPRNMSLENLKSVFNRFKQKGEDYDIDYNNSNHWAKKVYDYINKNY